MRQEQPVEQQHRRVALVMAGTKGLGFASAMALGREGAEVVICGREQGTLDAAVAALRDEGIEAHGVVADVSDAASLDALFVACDERCGRLDVVVANAGGPPPGGFEALTDEQWEAAFQLTFMSVVRAARLALPRFRQVGGGRFLVIGSSSVRRPIPGLMSSNALRPGLAGLVKSLATEVAAEGITVNMVSPGRIGTDRTQELDARKAAAQGVDVSEIQDASIRLIPAGRYGDPDELGAMIAFLASPAAGYVTAQSILVDGGLAPTLP
jgi:3-oxoacyl-[acyl-carrier protein] reductase